MSNKTMFCRSCGSNISRSDKFCTDCGTENDHYETASETSNREPTIPEDSDEWWRRIKASTTIGITAYIFSLFTEGAIAGVLVLIALVSIVIWLYSINQDAQIMKTADRVPWNPNPIVYSLAPLLFTPIGWYYMYKRHKYSSYLF